MINYKGTSTTPNIHFDESEGLVEIKGCSIPEDPKQFYKPLIDWLDNYNSNPKQITKVNIHLEDFNTGSSRYIEAILKKLESLLKENHDVTINWYYKDDDMYDAGKGYEALIKIPFKFIEVQD